MGGSYERVENERTNAMRRQRAELLLHLGAPSVDDSGRNRFVLLSQSSSLFALACAAIVLLYRTMWYYCNIVLR